MRRAVFAVAILLGCADLARGQSCNPHWTSGMFVDGSLPGFTYGFHRRPGVAV
jgi:hypothetical protein